MTNEKAKSQALIFHSSRSGGLGRGFLFGPSVVKVYRDYNVSQSHDFTPNIVYRDPGLFTSLDLTHTMSTSNGISPPSLNLPVRNGSSRTDSAAKTE